MSLGAKGVISVLSNIAPRAVHDMVKMYLDGDTAASTAPMTAASARVMPRKHGASST